MIRAFRAALLSVTWLALTATTPPTLTGNFNSASYPWHDPRAAGAACDGTTDDTSALNAFFAALPANGPVNVFIPGQCKITAPVTIQGKQNMNIVAWGGGGANAAAALGAPGFYCAVTTGNCLQVYASTITVSGISIQRIVGAISGCSIDVQGSSHSQFDKIVLNKSYNGMCFGAHTAPYGVQGDIDIEEVSGTTVAGGKAISFNGNTDGVVLRMVHFGGPQDSSSVFIWFDPTQTIDTVDVQSGGCFGYGRHLYVAPNAGQADVDIFVSKLLCDGATGGGAGVTIAGAGQAGVAIDHSFFGSFHENDNCGVEVGGGNPISGSIKESQISGFGRAGVCFDATPPGDFVLQGNTIEGNGNTTIDTFPAIQFAAGSGHARIYDNYLNGNGSQDYGIKFLGNASLVVVTRNELGGDSGQISYGSGTLSNLSVFNNTLYLAPAQYNPTVQSNIANSFTAQQTFIAGIIAQASSGPIFDSEGGNYYGAPNLLAKGNNNPGIRITDTFGTLGVDGADWAIGAGQSNSGGADSLIFLDARGATAQVAKLLNSGNWQLLLSGAKMIAPGGMQPNGTGGGYVPELFPLGVAGTHPQIITGSCAAVANAGTVCTFPNSRSFPDATFLCPSIVAEGATPHYFSYDTKTTTGFTAYSDAGTPTVDYICVR